MHLIKNTAFMFKYSWMIYKRIYFAVVIEILLNSIEPFIYLIFPTLIINELTSGQEWNTILSYVSLFIITIAGLHILRLIFQVFVNMSVNRCDVKNGLFYARHFLIMPYNCLLYTSRRPKEVQKICFQPGASQNENKALSSAISEDFHL